GHLVDDDEVAHGVLGGADAPGGLDADARPGQLVEVADGLQHDQGDGQRGGGLDLAGRRLDEVAAADHAEPRRPPDVVERDQLARLENDLEVGGAARRLDALDLVEHFAVAAGEEGAPVDHHVDLVGTGVDGRSNVGQLHF